jgi:pimeloyl-ACP methyl ester carboxylesterase
MNAFQISFPQAALEDLRTRLALTRWPDEPASDDWKFGTSPSYLRELTDYWQHNFDWRKQEERLNQLAHFHTTIDGTRLHFIHEHGRGPRPLALLLNHGWPDSFLRFEKIIPMLTDPEAFGGNAEDSFDIVAPSLPGFGFSDALPVPGSYGGGSASRLNELMTGTLGYKTYGAHGGDVGGSITERLALDYPASLTGIHFTDVPFTRMAVPPTDQSEAEQTFFKAIQQWRMGEAGYVGMQATKPLTLAQGLRDSPAGMAAWIIEKFRSWSDCGGDIESRFSKDELLTNLTIYWVTGTIGTSFLPYSQRDNTPQGLGCPKIEVPAGFVTLPADIAPAPKEFAERFYNVQRWTDMPKGGHFGAMEEPELIVEELRSFFRPLR